MRRELSDQYFEKAKTLFPGGVNSPVRAFGSVEGDPLFIEKSDGPYMWDVDGNQYIDFCCSWGPLILGHKHPAVMDAILTAVNKGSTFGAPSLYSLELADLIVANHRFIEKMRFVSSGTEAVMSAIRLARGYTGKSKIIKFDGCYHGHVDHLLVKAGSGLATFGVSSSAGVPEAFAKETLVAELNDLEALEQLFDQHKGEIAAIILEPVPANNGLLIQDVAYLKAMKALCEKNETLLIFDEVISGFRVGFEGAAGLYDIQPDIITFGKIIGGGMPVGAFAASSEIMSCVAPEGKVYQAGTLSANPVAMAAGLATIKECLKEDFYTSQGQRTGYLVASLNDFLSENELPVQLVQQASIFWLAFDRSRIVKASQIDPAGMNYFKKMHKLLLEEGVYLGPSGYEVGFVSAAHDLSVLDRAIDAFKKCFLAVFDRS